VRKLRDIRGAALFFFFAHLHIYNKAVICICEGTVSPGFSR
jgi:hypothetical protein